MLVRTKAVTMLDDSINGIEGAFDGRLTEIARAFDKGLIASLKSSYDAR